MLEPLRLARRRDSLFARLLLLQALLGLGYVALFGVLFYAERNATVARLLAEQWAPTLRALSGAHGSAGSAGPAPVLRAERPVHAVTAPAIGPRLAALDAALRERGVPLRSMAVALGNDDASLWLELEGSGGTPLWVGLPGDEITPNVPRRLLLGLALGVALLSLATWWFTRRLTRPLARLRDHMVGLSPDSVIAPQPALPASAAPELRAIDAAFADLLARYGRHQGERALLLAGVSHDLRSPLARIRMAAELLPATEANAMRREVIVRNVQVADRLIGSFLDHVRSGELPVDEAIDLAAVIRSAAEQAERPAAELRLESPPSLMLPRGNALLIERMVANLLDNAWQHGAAPVVLRVTVGPGQACIEVEDAGPGISPDARSRLLRAFARGDAGRGTPGLGLGLAVVQRGAERMGGRVEIEAGNAGKGCIVRVCLPR